MGNTSYIFLTSHMKNLEREGLLRKRKKKKIFHKDNAAAHKGTLVVGKLRDLKYELLEHTRYFTDLAPSDFNLFPNFKKVVVENLFRSNEDRSGKWIF